MTLRKDEYMIKGDSIIMPKKVLEEWNKEYQERARGTTHSLQSYYTGRRDTIIDLLKLFEPLEG